MATPSRLARLIGAIATCAVIAAAQCPPPAWSGANTLPGLDGSASASTLWDPDGAGPAPTMLVIGGSFRFVHDTVATGVAAWDGANWRAIGNGISGWVYAVTVYNGELIIGGMFTLPGFTTGPNLARFDGTTWQPLGPISDPASWSASVSSLAIFNGELVVGGAFTLAGGVAANTIARWNGTAWQALGSGMSHPQGTGSVQSLVAYGSDLYAGGCFDLAGGVVANSIARWDGTSWNSIGQGLLAGGSPGNARALLIFNGELVVGGTFETANGVSAPNIARWNGIWHAYPGGPAQSVWTLSVYNGELIIGGDFSPGWSGTGIPLNRVARWDGVAFQNLGPGVGNPTFDAWWANVRSLAVYGGKLYAMGKYFTIGTIDARSIARWNGASWETWPGGLYPVDVGGVVKAFTEHAGDLVAAGTFTCGGVKSYVARLTSGTWQPVGSGFNGFASSINALAVYNGELIAGGQFTDAGGVPMGNIARWGGSGWLPLGSGVDGIVYALSVWNGELVVGGAFTHAGGIPAQYIARWNGSAWLPFGSFPPYTAMPVTSLTVWNGMIVAAPGVWGWNGIWQAIGGGALVNTVGTYNGDLIAAGPFVIAYVGVGIAKWNGTAWSPLGWGLAGTGAQNGHPQPASLLSYGGELIVGGDFASAGGVAGTNGIAAWNGTSWHAVEQGTQLGAGAGALTSYGGALFAGGGFSTIGYGGSALVAKWSSPLALVRASQPNGNGTGIQIDNQWLVPGHEYFNIFSLDVCAGGPGTGPYGGLCANDFAALVQQALQPLGAAPFHYLATGSLASFGPYPAPVGLTFDVLCIDSLNLATGNLGCLSAVSRYTVY